ncbi:hypothetical protein ACSN7O_003569 [Enterobacter chuandaensis]
MKKTVMVAGICLLMSGCRAVSDDAWYVNTGMYSAVSDGAAYSVMASSLKERHSSQHLIQYSLRPKPGMDFRDGLARHYASALMAIDVTGTSPGSLACVSGEIRYYGTEHYVNGRLAGDIIETIPLPRQSFRLEKNQPVIVTLPRDTVFVIELSTEQKMLNPALKVNATVDTHFRGDAVFRTASVPD